METLRRKKQSYSCKIKVLILLICCLTFSACKKEDEYPTKDSVNNQIGPNGINVTGLFNVYYKTVPFGTMTSNMEIEEISYDQKENQLVSRKVIGNSTLMAGEIQWKCPYFSNENIGTYFLANLNGTVQSLPCTIKLVDENQITCKRNNDIDILLIRRFVGSK